MIVAEDQVQGRPPAGRLHGELPDESGAQVGWDRGPTGSAVPADVDFPVGEEVARRDEVERPRRGGIDGQRLERGDRLQAPTGEGPGPSAVDALMEFADKAREIEYGRAGRIGLQESRHGRRRASGPPSPSV